MNPDFQPAKAQLIMTLRGMGILDAATLAALEQVPRELFIPPALRHHSYENASLPIAYDQTISQPYVIARMPVLSSLAVFMPAFLNLRNRMTLPL